MKTLREVDLVLCFTIAFVVVAVFVCVYLRDFREADLSKFKPTDAHGLYAVSGKPPRAR